jgi:hypothetical protein
MMGELILCLPFTLFGGELKKVIFKIILPVCCGEGGEDILNGK